MRASLRGSALWWTIAMALALVGKAHAWTEIRGAVGGDSVECVSWSPGRIDCFSRTPSGSLAWVYLENGRWSTTHDLGGKIAAGPACVVRGPGGINCFAVSAKGVLASIYLNGSTWSRWVSLGGELKPSRVSCVALARDRIACFARGRRDQLMMRRWSGGKTWEPWRDLGGAVSADPECILAGISGAACFGRGAAGELVAFLPDVVGNAGAWATLGGRIEGKPSCVRLASGEVACVAQSANARLHLWRGRPVAAENPGSTATLDEPVIADPTCALQAEALVCLTRNGRRQLVRHALTAGAQISREGVVDAPVASAIACLSYVEADIGCILTGVDHRIYFSAGRDLSAPALADVQAVEGEWYLANLESGGICRVVLLPELAFGRKRLRFGRRCRVVGLMGQPAQWDHDGDALIFMAADGLILARFRAVLDGRWLSASRGPALALTRELPGPDEPGSEPNPEPEADETGQTGGPAFQAWRTFAAGDPKLDVARRPTEPEPGL